MNDRTDLCLAAGCDGVHLGQDDLSPAAARSILASALPDASGEEREWWIGFSTHNLQQVADAEQFPVNYIAVGPIFPTSTKVNAEPVVGLETLARICKSIQKPVVAIGGDRPCLWRRGLVQLRLRRCRRDLGRLQIFR